MFELGDVKNFDVERGGFAVRTILVAVLWTILLGSSLGYTVKYAIELTALVKDAPTVAKHRGTIRIGVFNWAGYYPLVVAQELGLFKKYGLDVELVPGKTTGELNDWIRTGRTQATVGVLADFVILRDLGTPIRMMTATDYSLADVIVGRPSLKKPHDLIGKRIGLAELNSFAEYFVIRSLELSGINPRTVDLYTVPAQQVPEAILNGEIDAGHTWDPALARGLRRGLKPVLSSSTNPRLVIDGIAFRSEITQTLDAPLAIIRAFFEAMAFQKTDSGKFTAIVSKYFRIDPAEAQRYLEEDIRFADLDENIRLYGANGILKTEALEIARFFADRGMGNPEDDLKSLIDESVIRRLEDEQTIGFSPSPQNGRATSRVDKSLRR